MKVAVITPCYSGMVNLDFFMSFMTTMQRIRKAEFSFIACKGCSDLPGARNGLIARALAQGADKIVMIDDDISWNSDDFPKLVLGPAPIMAGAYQKRPHHPFEKPEMAISLFEHGMVADERGLIEVEGAATGFMRVDREVFEAMKPHCEKYDDKSLTPEENAHLHMFFAWGWMEKEGQRYRRGEDYNFCERARGLGFKTVVDPTIKLGHHVGQFKFGATLPEIPVL